MELTAQESGKGARSRGADLDIGILGFVKLHMDLTFGLKNFAYGSWVLDAARKRAAEKHLLLYQMLSTPAKKHLGLDPRCYLINLSDFYEHSFRLFRTHKTVISDIISERLFLPLFLVAILIP